MSSAVSDHNLSREACESIAARVFAFARGGGESWVQIHSWWNGELRWARNHVSLASDRRDLRIMIYRTRDLGFGWVSTNQIDDASLEAAVRAAERNCEINGFTRHPLPASDRPPMPPFQRPTTAIWSDVTNTTTVDTLGALVRQLVAPAKAKGLLSAGYIEMRAGSMMQTNSLRGGGEPAPWDVPYIAWTQAQGSLTVRDPEGTGSGWAGLSSDDWSRLDPMALATRAIDKCVASQHPVALEPGRYTVILEPQAVADLWELATKSFVRELAEAPQDPWFLAIDDALGLGRSKLGRKVVDERITVSHDPADPALGIVPGPWDTPVTWIDHGVLTNLYYDRDYALKKLNTNGGVRSLAGYRMSGGQTSIESMVQSTERGLLVTRLSTVQEVDHPSLLMTGLTRDGLWLIEHGKISKAVKNLRFTESPLFALNNIDALGEPVPVFRPVKNPYEDGAPLTPAIVPAIKARDFSFTSTIDAI
ncbi:MAG TPA: metallopeptidase TldD-related protein [Gemmatimonadaceae bacterium]|nr:metallopeptidase TldD-related protein [Gemmatimonadaceae bacterium]